MVFKQINQAGLIIICPQLWIHFNLEITCRATKVLAFEVAQAYLVI